MLLDAASRNSYLIVRVLPRSGLHAEWAVRLSEGLTRTHARWERSVGGESVVVGGGPTLVREKP